MTVLLREASVNGFPRPQQPTATLPRSRSARVSSLPSE